MKKFEKKYVVYSFWQAVPMVKLNESENDEQDQF